MKFNLINDERVEVLDDKGMCVGHIFSPSGSGGHPIGGIWVEKEGKYFHESHTEKKRLLFDIR